MIPNPHTCPPSHPASVHPPAGRSRLVHVKLTKIVASSARTITMALGAMVITRNAELRLAHLLGTSVKQPSQPNWTMIGFVCQRWTDSRKFTMVTLDRTMSNRNLKVSSYGRPMAALQTQVSSFASQPVMSAQRMDGCLHQCVLRRGSTSWKRCTDAQRQIMLEAGACTTMEQMHRFICIGGTNGLIARDASRSRSCDSEKIYRLREPVCC